MSKGIRVLIVEDEPLVGEMIAGLLEDLGHTAIGKALNGREGVAMTASTRPDVVLMDLEMPGMDGIEATRKIQASSPTPVVALTAHDSQEWVERASIAGIGAYVLKPPNAREIERAITIAMARFGDLMELRRINAELETALARVKTLSGLLPICASCKKIRDSKGSWHQVEVYVRDHSEAQFSHGLCPQCAEEYYPGFGVLEE
ncbi:MAG: response regulator [bacterium]|nr:response regulator [bacterium]